MRIARSLVLLAALAFALAFALAACAGESTPGWTFAPTPTPTVAPATQAPASGEPSAAPPGEATPAPSGGGTGVSAPYYIAKGCTYHGVYLSAAMVEQARQLKGNYMTVDEIRVEAGLKALPAQLGSVVLGIQRAQQIPGGFGPSGASSANADQLDPDAHGQLMRTLGTFIQAVHDGKAVRHTALEQGHKLIKIYVDGEIERAKGYMAAQMGVPVLHLSPEMSDHFKRMFEEYMATYDKLLSGAMKATE
jgi:hypothetical protein